MTCKISARILLIDTTIDKLTKERVELVAKLAAASLVNDIAAGYHVSFKVGRAETRREVTGVVLGRGLVKDVDTLRVSVGEGFDSELFNVKVAEVITVTAPVHVPSTIAVALGTAAAGTSESDDVLDGLVG